MIFGTKPFRDVPVDAIFSTIDENGKLFRKEDDDHASVYGTAILTDDGEEIRFRRVHEPPRFFSCIAEVKVLFPFLAREKVSGKSGKNRK